MLEKSGNEETESQETGEINTVSSDYVPIDT